MNSFEDLQDDHQITIIPKVRCTRSSYATIIPKGSVGFRTVVSVGALKSPTKRHRLAKSTIKVNYRHIKLNLYLRFVPFFGKINFYLHLHVVM